MPMVTGPIAIVYNVDGVKDLRLKPATIAKIFSGAITTWDAAEIKADNPDATLPSTPILAVHRSDESGTTDNFTKYLLATAKNDWTYEGGKAWPISDSGQGEKGSDGVASAVKSGAGAIGYVEWSFAQVNDLSMAKVYNGAGEYTAFTGEAAGKTVAGAKIVGTGNDLKMKIDYTTTEAGAYPIVLVTYEIVCEKGTDSAKLPLLKSFMTFISSSDGQALLPDLGYAPLADSVRDKVAAAVGKARADGCQRIHIVTHSLGAVIVRSYLQDHQLPQESRIVMLAPPNQGSELADWAKENFPRLFQLAGPAAADLGTEGDTFTSKLKPIAPEVGIIIGKDSWNPLFSKILPGQDDGAVTVERARLREMQDFLVAPCNHTSILLDQYVREQVIHFLHEGRFR